jgi:hypothetical protein
MFEFLRTELDTLPVVAPTGSEVYTLDLEPLPSLNIVPVVATAPNEILNFNSQQDISPQLGFFHCFLLVHIDMITIVIVVYLILPIRHHLGAMPMVLAIASLAIGTNQVAVVVILCNLVTHSRVVKGLEAVFTECEAHGSEILLVYLANRATPRVVNCFNFELEIGLRALTIKRPAPEKAFHFDFEDNASFVVSAIFARGGNITEHMKSVMAWVVCVPVKTRQISSVPASSGVAMVLERRPNPLVASHSNFVTDVTC